MLVFSHDAGGAEVISAWAREQDDHDLDYCLAGPALNVFSRKIALLPLLPVERALDEMANYDCILTGSSWPSEYERQAIVTAKERKVPVATYLDHWVGYRERLTLKGELQLPNELWVGDEYALELARRIFPDHPIRLQPNRYFSQMADEIGKLPNPAAQSGEGRRVLYLAEPMSNPSTGIETLDNGQPKYIQYSEFDALQGYLCFLRANTSTIDSVRIRRHPSEPHGKYAPKAEEFAADFRIEVDVDTTLQEDCAWADWVVGCQTMALVIALHAGKTVFSCIPPGGAPLTLPYPEIRRVFH